MENNFDVNIRGIAEFNRALFTFNARMGERVTRQSLRQGANFMLKNIRAAAPKKTGRLRRAIKIKNSKINRVRSNGKLGIYISIAAGKSRTDPKGAYYGKFVESGHRGRRGGVVEGKRFIKNTFEATKEQAAQLIVSASEASAQRLAQEIGFNVSST